MRGTFRKISDATAQVAGSPFASVLAATLILAWIVGGFVFGFGDTYQLVINTATTIITFLMVFLIQATQNRDTRAIHLKLDEIALAIPEASNRVIDLEHCSDEELDRLEQEFRTVRESRA